MTNVLALLQARLRRELGTLENPHVRSVVTQLENQIIAFGELHGLLTVSGQSRQIQAADYVGRLCQSLATAVLEPIEISCEALIEEGFLPANVCEKLALVITELVLNAAKHAFRKKGSGVVRIEFRVNAGSWRCIVSDNGAGISANTRGRGIELVDALIAEMGAHISRRTGHLGTRVTVASWPE